MSPWWMPSPMRRARKTMCADALGALAAGVDVLRCQCGEPNCEASQRGTGTNVVIHVLAEESAVKGGSQAPGYLPGFGPVPSTLLRDLAGATITRSKDSGGGVITSCPTAREFL
jgi:hypothetical protein